jgi:hypothetical protein
MVLNLLDPRCVILVREKASLNKLRKEFKGVVRVSAYILCALGILSASS